MGLDREFTTFYKVARRGERDAETHEISTDISSETRQAQQFALQVVSAVKVLCAGFAGSRASAAVPMHSPRTSRGEPS
mgnify:CR=1 FL=1